MSEEEIGPEEEYEQDSFFYRSTHHEYIKMSDGAELLVYYTRKGKHPSKMNILFVPGFSTGPYSWNDFWDGIYEEFNLFVVDKREIKSSKVKWAHKGNMKRLALDLKEIVEYFDIPEDKLILMGPCLGASIIAHTVAEGFLKPVGTIMNAPVRKFFLPKALMPLAYIFPAFFMGILGIPLIRTWAKLSLPPGRQRKTYLENISNANGMRWKKMLSLSRWDSFKDYPKINIPTLVVGFPKDKVHENKITKQVAELIETSTYFEAPSYYWGHYSPGAKEYAMKVISYVSSLKNA